MVLKNHVNPIYIKSIEQIMICSCEEFTARRAAFVAIGEFAGGPTPR
jgi:hypothetical protein